MPFIELPDDRGKIYVPDKNKGSRKKPCPDCFSCNWCSDDRCLRCRPLCRQHPPKTPRK